MVDDHVMPGHVRPLHGQHNSGLGHDHQHIQTEGQYQTSRNSAGAINRLDHCIFPEVCQITYFNFWGCNSNKFCALFGFISVTK